MLQERARVRGELKITNILQHSDIYIYVDICKQPDLYMAPFDATTHTPAWKRFFLSMQIIKAR